MLLAALKSMIVVKDFFTGSESMLSLSDHQHGLLNLLQVKKKIPSLGYWLLFARVNFPKETQSPLGPLPPFDCNKRSKKRALLASGRKFSETFM